MVESACPIWCFSFLLLLLRYQYGLLELHPEASFKILFWILVLDSIENKYTLIRSVHIDLFWKMLYKTEWNGKGMRLLHLYKYKIVVVVVWLLDWLPSYIYLPLTKNLIFSPWIQWQFYFRSLTLHRLLHECVRDRYNRAQKQLQPCAGWAYVCLGHWQLCAGLKGKC